ncbi:uncharacterized protein LOC106171466 [Lingula anatina]|uniref:Uncharacterized protein LOC106171466 n=1 Tax=Lingula anatina TaxID=7574 RepID=A0A2R2MJ19_LINAN|nr:uncharacterized protein LOC106171466 [Lingula anatina]|eukprot:XP_023930221.1 uncharacterized protein LOC106171466 [Lingula anatina]
MLTRSNDVMSVGIIYENPVSGERDFFVMADIQLPHSHIPYGKEGSGFFSDYSSGCFNVIDAATPMVLDALDKVPVKSLDAPFIIADFGTADGGTSIFLITKMIGKLSYSYICCNSESRTDGLHTERLRKRHGKELPLQVVYEDQPCNDFKSLFFRIHGRQ